jgi:hypothetical protein
VGKRPRAYIRSIQRTKRHIQSLVPPPTSWVCRSRPSPWELHGKGVGSHAFIVDRAWPQDGLSTNSVSGSGAMLLGVAGFGASPSTAEDSKSGRTAPHSMLVCNYTTTARSCPLMKKRARHCKVLLRLVGIRPRYPCQAHKWQPNAYKYGLIGSFSRAP